MKHLLLLILFFAVANSFAQTNIFPSTGAAGIGTTIPDPSSLLDIASTSKGMLIPRMNKAQRDAITTPSTGLLIYQTNSTPGFYYFEGSVWTAVSPTSVNKSLSNLTAPTAVNVNLLAVADNTLNLGSANNSWKDAYLDGSLYLGGNRFLSYIAGTGTGNTAIGAAVLNANTTGINNTGVGFRALFSNTTGNYNTANGNQALQFNSIGGNNTATGYKTLQNNTTGSGNVANGLYALINNTTGYSNVAIGARALASNTTGHNLVAVGDSALFNQSLNSGDFYMNTAVGSKTLYSNTFGGLNTATGYQSLYSNTSGFYNTANGVFALKYNTTGDYNTANGEDALYSNIIGEYNTANGVDALYKNTSGGYNTANGANALLWNTTGDYNVANGKSALYLNTSGDYNTANGASALSSNTSGSNNTAVGFFADVSSGHYSNSTALGNSALITASNQVRIGNTDITSIGGYKAWTNLSDGRVKKNIKANVPGLAFINLLKPITYNLDLDAADKIIQRPAMKDKEGKTIQPTQEQITSRQIQQQVVCTGFIAQDVEASAKKIGYDFDGVDAAKNDKDLYGLRYSEFVVPLVKAVQELSKQNDSLKQNNTTLLSDNKILHQQLNDINARINQIENAMGQCCSSFSSNMQPVTGNQSSAKNFDAAKLEQNVPNPFNNSSSIAYYIPSGSHNVQLMITDIAGHVLKTYSIAQSGYGKQTIYGNQLRSGMYEYSLLIDGKLIDTKKMILGK